MSLLHLTTSSDIDIEVEIEAVGALIDQIYALSALEDVDFRLKVILDSGTGIHIVNDKAYFRELRELPTAKYIESAGGTRTPLQGIGTFTIPSFNIDGEPTELCLTGYYSPVTPATLLSPGLLKRESNIIFDGFHDALYDRQSGVHIATVH